MELEDALLVAEGRRRAADGSGQAIREANDLYVTDVATAVGVTPTTVYRWEKGDRVPRGAAAARYARLLRCLEAVTAARAAAS